MVGVSEEDVVIKLVVVCWFGEVWEREVGYLPCNFVKYNSRQSLRADSAM